MDRVVYGGILPKFKVNQPVYNTQATVYRIVKAVYQYVRFDGRNGYVYNLNTSWDDEKLVDETWLRALTMEEAGIELTVPPAA